MWLRAGWNVAICTRLLGRYLEWRKAWNIKIFGNQVYGNSKVKNWQYFNEFKVCVCEFTAIKCYIRHNKLIQSPVEYIHLVGIWHYPWLYIRNHIATTYHPLMKTLNRIVNSTGLCNHWFKAKYRAKTWQTLHEVVKATPNQIKFDTSKMRRLKPCRTLLVLWDRTGRIQICGRW
jgi:hypothetical protein